MKQKALYFIFAVVFIIAFASPVWGGTIEYVGGDAPGITNYSIVFEGANNDNMDIDPEEFIIDSLIDLDPEPFNTFFFEKNFTNTGPIDLDFSGAPSGGTTEYFFYEHVTNSSGFNWESYQLQIGARDVNGEFFSLAAAGLSTILFDLDFDLPDADPTPVLFDLDFGQDIDEIFQEINSTLIHENHHISFDDILIEDQDDFWLAFGLDIPDPDIQQLPPEEAELFSNFQTLVLRQTLTIERTAVIPEPATMVLFASGLAGAFFRRKS